MAMYFSKTEGKWQMVIGTASLFIYLGRRVSFVSRHYFASLLVDIHEIYGLPPVEQERGQRTCIYVDFEARGARVANRDQRPFKPKEAAGLAGLVPGPAKTAMF